MASNTPQSLSPAAFDDGALLIVKGAIARKALGENILNCWWTNEHLPQCLLLPGFLRARRYYNCGYKSPDKSQYLTLYEASSIRAFTSERYLALLNNPSPESKANLAMLASVDRSVCRLLYTAKLPGLTGSVNRAIGGTLAYIAFVPPAESGARAALRNFITTELVPYLFGSKALLVFHLAEHDEAATREGSTTESYADVPFRGTESAGADGPGKRKWILLLEFPSTAGMPQDVENGRRNVAGAAVWKLEREGAWMTENMEYQLMCAVER